LAPDMKGNQWL